ncbi:PREDICTED: mitochondrial import receptor subunit TOM22 homolog [Myotis davidii]|uniref:mitochondrial import receptor subunit TOM22 homolog n=1 Tax=Myotis davidii TaxID=225400 RepID=UPI00076729F4|nr:PREDICTED: mitochondrial import receptor subunit TOM22 homolog [Myotis davidii]
MAAIIAALSPGAPLPLDKLLLKGNAGKTEELEEDDNDEPDETLLERLWGLTELFPERIQSGLWPEPPEMFYSETELGPNTGLSGGMPGALPSLPGKI